MYERPRRSFFSLFPVIVVAIVTLPIVMFAQTAFRNAPSTAGSDKNPYAGNATAAAAGKKVYAQNCAQCHGNNLQGMGPAPALDTASVRKAKPGELFWFITTGKLSSGMPSWTQLSKQQRWQIVTFLESSPSAKSASK